MPNPRPETNRKVLYISYDGLTDPLGRSQILPYLIGLSKRGHSIDLISCDKPHRLREHGDSVRRICRKAGIGWHSLPYHKRPPILSSMYDVALARRTADRLHRRNRYDLVHCRTDMAGLVGLWLKRRHGMRFLYDMRSFWPDERVEGGLWSLSNPAYRLVYRYFKAREADFLREADHIVSLTQAGQRILLDRPDRGAAGAPITVIPCCADFAHFATPNDETRAAKRQALGVAEGSKLVAYLGSVGTWYMLAEMLDFFRVYRSRYPDARLLMLTPDEPRTILTAARASGVPEEALIIRSASREEVPAILGAADLGLFFIKPVFSKQASSPTKLGEMLALGLPIIANAGVGDVERIIEETGAGIALNRFDDRSYAEAIDAVEALDFHPEAVRRRAKPWFDVEVGIERYDSIYRSLES